MKYTFTKEDGTKKTVEIADDWIAKTKRALRLSDREVIDLWLCDNGYRTNEEQEQLNQKAAAGDAGLRVQSKERKKPERKPDEVKRDMIQSLYEHVSRYAGVQSPHITNIERTIAFAIGEEQFEITLTKKRKPKV